MLDDFFFAATSALSALIRHDFQYTREWCGGHVKEWVSGFCMNREHDAVNLRHVLIFSDEAKPMFWRGVLRREYQRSMLKASSGRQEDGMGERLPEVSEILCAEVG
ncbi:hypothetical protein [Mycetohabitans endofungorum]|uniref:hypothetical protein n=1 Tax=Mycetohabitans endofungorum TaxID=417203 RepID=UPI002B05A7C9|nr:hypothetical protein [Mycetohabitans endofungorum]